MLAGFAGFGAAPDGPKTQLIAAGIIAVALWWYFKRR